jgi:hypothetical protein
MMSNDRRDAMILMIFSFISGLLIGFIVRGIV